MTIYLEDLVIGEKVIFGSHRFTKEEILIFARDFDPQPFHVDEAAAERSIFGKLSASGWHTAAMWMRAMVDYRQRQAEADHRAGKVVPPSGPSPGINKLRWLKPVYVGDTITYTSTVTDKLDDPKRPDWGIAVTHDEGVNQKGEAVYSAIGRVYVKRREPLKTKPRGG
ncbi:MAG: MaoC family dehydratase [Hyphomicrobiaceae bacterium]|jgi:acyl dehydratase